MTEFVLSVANCIFGYVDGAAQAHIGKMAMEARPFVILI